MTDNELDRCLASGLRYLAFHHEMIELDPESLVVAAMIQTAWVYACNANLSRWAYKHRPDCHEWGKKWASSPKSNGTRRS